MNAEISSIISDLKQKRGLLQAELARIEKAIDALSSEKKVPKQKKAAAPVTEAPAEPGVKVTREAVLEVCASEFCNAEKAAHKLGCETTRAASILSSLFSAGKLDREGTRGSYEYRVKVADASPFNRGATA